VFARIKRTPGLSVESYLAQQQLGSRELTLFQERVLSTLSERSRSAKRIGAVLQDYADLVIHLPPAEQASFLPVDPPTKLELWERAVLAAEDVMQPIFAQKHPKNRINWCNMTEPEQGRAWGWRALRNAMVAALANKAGVWLCTTGIFSDKLQLTVDMAPVDESVRPGLETAIRNALGKRAKRVLEWGTPRLIYEVSWPVEPTTIEWVPQEPARAPAKPEGRQPALFQSLLRTKLRYPGR
jgi:hypothetical protein